MYGTVRYTNTSMYVQYGMYGRYEYVPCSMEVEDGTEDTEGECSWRAQHPTTTDDSCRVGRFFAKK